MEVVLVVFLLDKIGNVKFSIFSPPPVVFTMNVA